eukprot:TRINITY_DN14876_c0_g1_i2.p2 TRINITY_DN14876_c0_g1~~TRINITY_DN14876_c0_g1_i2.p2  ORF type:complete len:220 (+),score=-18.90 TRINITY_DN14876_c0_g1_i2:715-1374(+)
METGFLHFLKDDSSNSSDHWNWEAKSYLDILACQQTQASFHQIVSSTPAHFRLYSLQRLIPWYNPTQHNFPLLPPLKYALNIPQTAKRVMCFALKHSLQAAQIEWLYEGEAVTVDVQAILYVYNRLLSRGFDGYDASMKHRILLCLPLRIQDKILSLVFHVYRNSPLGRPLLNALHLLTDHLSVGDMRINNKKTVGLVFEFSVILQPIRYSIDLSLIHI